MSADVDIDEWLNDAGYGLPAAKEKARVALEEAALTRPGKSRISEGKLARAEESLRARYFLHCSNPECATFAKGSGREPLPCNPKSTCERCGGSDNQRAVRDLLEACRRSSVTRLVVVGGSPALHEELSRLLSGAALEVRLVDGTRVRPIERARADLDWAEVVLLWGATELHHKVSLQYSQAPVAARRKLVHVTRRGITQLLSAAVEHLRAP